MNFKRIQLFLTWFKILISLIPINLKWLIPINLKWLIPINLKWLIPINLKWLIPMIGYNKLALNFTVYYFSIVSFIDIFYDRCDKIVLGMRMEFIMMARVREIPCSSLLYTSCIIDKSCSNIFFYARNLYQN